jgi:hypothetical protein
VKNRWGREEPYRWPSAKPVWTITALALGVVALLAAAGYEYTREWTYFQQAYLRIYVGSEVRLWGKSAPYRIAYRIEGKQKRAAVDRDLSDAAVLSGKVKIAWERGTYDNAELHRWLEQAIYEGQSPWLLLWAAVWRVGACVLLVGLAVALPHDQERRRVLKYGRRMKGPELVTAVEFNRRQQSNGIGFITEERRTPSEFLLRCDGKMVRVPRARESEHFLLMGDRGAGKSSLIRQILTQVEGRGETAIVYDPALEYTAQFYEPERGDAILNPLDARMPYWTPCDEARHEAEAEGLAAALFQDDPRTHPSSAIAARQIFAHLLVEQPKRTPEELLAILRDERELAKRLKDAGPQRGGIMAALNRVSDALQLLPRKAEAKTSWTATEWAQQRKGWLFIASPPEFRERLRPLLSMWLDMLALRLMNQGKPGVRPVWFMLDELQSLHALPHLYAAITENRKVKNPVVLGFQGRSQLEELYGGKAEAMLTQPATKIFLRTDEANSAKWISQTIGEVETERLRDTRKDGIFRDMRRGARTRQLERVVDPLVKDSEIAGMSDLYGYVKSGNLVVRLSFPYIESAKRHEAFIERKLTNQPHLREENKLPAAGGDGRKSSARPVPGQNQPRNLPLPFPSQREQPPKQPPAAQAGDDELPFLK